MRLRRVLGLLLLVAGVVAWVLQARRTGDEWVGVELDPEPVGAVPDRGPADVPAADVVLEDIETAEVEVADVASVDVPLATAEVDDLTAIDGVGPKIAAALAAAGLGTYAAVADASDDELRAALRAAGARASATLPSWASQARALAG